MQVMVIQKLHLKPFYTSYHPEKNVDMSQPNNILGLQYIKAILLQNSSMQAQTIKKIRLSL